MRIALGIIGIVAGLLAFAQSIVVDLGSDAIGDVATAEAAAGGMAIGLLFVVAGAFAFGLPLVSFVVFAFAGLVGFVAANQGDFTDLRIWAGGALALAGLSLVASWKSAEQPSAARSARSEPSVDTSPRAPEPAADRTPARRSPPTFHLYPEPTSSHWSPATMLRHYTNAMRNYAIFAGRASRGEFWSFYAVFLVMAVIVVVLDESYFGSTPERSGIVSFLFAAVHILPGMAVQVRRLHDIDWSGWAILLNAVPIANVVALVLACRAGTQGPNRFGAAPGRTDEGMIPTRAHDAQGAFVALGREPAFSGSHDPVRFDPAPVAPHPAHTMPNAPYPDANAPAARAGGRDPIADIERLAMLRDNGSISDNEFQAMKAKALSAAQGS